MKLYFDHNVYARITDRKEVGLVEDWLHATGNSILSSQVTLLEALRIPGDADRAARIRTITRLCPSFPTPHAFLDAGELRDELKRVRPSWLRARPDTAAIDLHLNDHRRHWRSVRADPSYRSPEFGHVEAVLGPGVGVVRDFHSAGRALAQRDTGGQTTQDMAALLDAAWRIESMAVWHGALFERNPVMRDYWTIYRRTCCPSRSRKATGRNSGCATAARIAYHALGRWPLRDSSNSVIPYPQAMLWIPSTPWGSSIATSSSLATAHSTTR
ncbi:MAG TPA: hypothetical protein VES62_07795 [Thermoleophilaceae bacterium]|nr:hypothetical protein [Thermoleophilaceae bacterium]